MKRLISGMLLLGLLVCTAPAAAEPFTPAAAAPKLEQLEISATFAPPHNEPVVGDRVARYRLQAELDLRWWRLQWQPKVTAWGVNRWRPTDVVGHGIPQAWENSDWSVEKWRISHTQSLSLWLTDALALTTEYYMPVDRKSWGGHGLERHYYWLVGAKWTLK